MTPPVAVATAPHPRAGKAAGEVDWRHVLKSPWLRVNAAMILGICDPVLMPSPMSEEEGAWVREHAWTPGLRAIEDVYPYGIHRWCACQSGWCWNCLNKRCDICVHRQHAPEADVDAGTITDRHGYVVALIVHLPHQKPCRWVCKCAHVPAAQAAPEAEAPEPPPAVAARRRAQAPMPGQDSLFEVIA